MAYYLKWPADTGTAAGNNKLCQLSGIATTGNVNIALKFAENVVDPSTTSTKGAYLYDGRRTLDSTTVGAGGYFLENNNAIEQSGTSNYKLNGATSTNSGWRSALADDTYSFDTTSQVDGVLSIGARYTQTEHMPLLALKSITITDNSGTHIVDMSSSNGIADTFTSLDGAITLKLFGFTGGQWVFYSSGAYTLTADGATFSYSGGIASTIYNRVLSADGGSFSYSGGVAATLLNRRIAADGATFGYSGGASALLYGRALQAAGGSFSYSGGVATFVYNPITGYVLNADGGIFSYAGGEAALSFNQNYPTANPNDYTVSAYLSTDSTYTARLSETSTINAIISASSTFNARLN